MMGSNCPLQGPQCCAAAVPLGGVSGGSQVQCVSGSLYGGMKSTVTLWRVENLAWAFLNLSLSMTSLRCSCCMQVSVCVCWWFKKILGRNLSTGDGVFFVVFCCTLQGIRKLVIVYFKASNN